VIDLHNHILPGVDDGAADLRTALHMLEIAAAQGITHVACTSHANDRATEETDRLFQSVFLQVKKAANDHGLPVELTLGAELMIGADILKTLTLPFATYGGSGAYALIEFPTEIPFEIILNVVISVRRKGIWPVIAHYERFPRAQRNPDQPRALREAGAVLTLDAGSLVGQFGPIAAKRAKQLLSWNCIDILASDAHNDTDHGFALKAGYDAAAEQLGITRARELVEANPRRVWDAVPWKDIDAVKRKIA
jgi:protein-tyrosine phosphatase